MGKPKLEQWKKDKLVREVRRLRSTLGRDVGMPLVVVQGWLGHGSPSTTMRYLRRTEGLVPDQARAALGAPRTTDGPRTVGGGGRKKGLSDRK